MNVLPLDTLKRRADQNAYSIEQIDWSRGVDFGRLFFPEHLTPLSHTAVYAELTPDERRTYNQLYGLAINEQFIFLEDRFLVRIVSTLRARTSLDLPADLRDALEVFLDEEVKHTEMFRRLARLTDPERYARSDYSFLRLGRVEDAFLAFMSRRPDLFVFWCWLALAFEEKTIDYYRHYQRHNKERPDAPLDPLYTDVHRLHMLDEVRHVQIDHHLIKVFYDRTGPLVRAMNFRLLARTMNAYTRPRRTNLRIVEELVRRCPRLAPRLEDMKTQLRALATCRDWQEITYSRKNAPQTFALFDEYPEMHALAGSVLLCYEPRGV
ncbi:MAG: diiron oxygenase [Planctomycetes bacterium]|nr:diiron oxygenase [Planctomycetota bacterium]